jgi:hypothetical protein
MGPDDDVYTFIDRADPGQPLMGECLSNILWVSDFLITVTA